MENSLAIKEARNFDPHMLREREEMAEPVKEKFLGGKPDIPSRSKLERPESGLAVNIKELFPKGGKAALSSLSKGSAWGKEP